MSLPESYVLYSEEEYLSLEREAKERSEYLDGQIFAMAGESLNHGRICVNLTGMINTQLKGRRCEVLSKDMKVRSGPTPPPRRSLKGMFSYPDLLVVCGEPKLHDKHRDVLLNPTVIIEVLSPTTEAFDRGEKWARYQTWLPELVDYILVSQSKPQIESFHRIVGGEWVYSLVNTLEDGLCLSSVDCTLKLADVYDRVVFEDDALVDETSEA